MLKQVLLASCVLGLATSVAAADITNPFYQPKQNEVGTTTSVAFRKQRSKATYEYIGGWADPDWEEPTEFFFTEGTATSRYNNYNTIVQEDLLYGLTDNLSLVVGVGNTFGKSNFKKDYDTSYMYYKETPFEFEEGDLDWRETESDKTDYNPQWSVGLAWNILTGPTRLQLMAKYGQDKLLNNGESGEYKYVNANVKFGYQFQKLLPYISVGEELPVAQAHGYNKPEYNVKLGLYQGACEKWALDTGVRWIHSEDAETQGYLAEAEASYYLNPKTALSLYGTYSFKGEAKDEDARDDVKWSDKSIGMRLRKVF